MAAKNSNSVGNVGGLIPWLKENFSFFVMRVRGLRNKHNELIGVLNEIDRYEDVYQRITGCSLISAGILEIGYGARPNRLIALMSLGYAARGIDLDGPILKGRLTEFVRVYNVNGFTRLVKTLIRHVLFDSHERRCLRRILRARGNDLAIDESRFLVGDARTFLLCGESIDFIYSEDVFEHIPADAIHTVCQNLRTALSANGVALISPSVHTGIAGGHLVEWYPHTLESKITRKSEPWEHLRKRRYHADCYLNELRVHDFKDIFENYFDVVNITSIHPGLGKEFLTPQIREELSAYSEAELLSDKWTFVLRKKVKI